MTPRIALRRLARDDRGSVMVEYSVAVALFLALLFVAMDFGRLLYNWNMAEKAMQIAARTAAVRPALDDAYCGGVTLPTTNARGSVTAGIRYGAACSSADNICAGQATAPVICTPPATITCPPTGTPSTTEAEIWCRIRKLLPTHATPRNLLVTYRYDPKLNFLGGPYVPVVTVELQDLDFRFVTPIMGLLRATGGAVAGTNAVPANLRFPSMSVSLPGEDLALGDAG